MPRKWEQCHCFSITLLLCSLQAYLFRMRNKTPSPSAKTHMHMELLRSKGYWPFSPSLYKGSASFRPVHQEKPWLESISSQVLQTNRLKRKSTQSFSLSHCKAVVWTQARYSHCLLVFQSLPQTLPGKHGRIPTWWYSCLEHCYSVELLFMSGTVQAG